jgi:CubicO group peptidase (beta-lactamase class C family)
MNMRKAFRFGSVLVFIAFLVFINAASGLPLNASNISTGGPTDPKELEAFMDGTVNAELKAHHIPGATVAVVKNGQIIFAKGYGYADISKRKAVVANQTLFRIGSVSKLFIWTAVMQLAEQNKLDLDADVNIYLKDFQIPANYPEPITLKDLMTHTSGFEDLATGGRLFVRNETDIVPMGEYLKDKMPARVRPPGEVTAYSNYGSALAAYIVEQVSGMPFDKYVEKKILLPLSMNNSSFQQPLSPRLASNMSNGYLYSNNAFIAQPFENVQVWPAGSMSTTSEDMAKFMIAHLQNGRYGNSSILNEATAQQMHSQLFTNDPKVSGWTYGFWEMRLNNQSMIGHGGDTILFHTLLELLPEQNLGIFVSFNEQASEPAGGELLQIFMDHYYPVPSQPLIMPSPGFENNSNKFPGSYRSTRSAYTNFEKVSSLFQEVQVNPGRNSTLTTSQPGLGQEQWVEAAPLVFRPGENMSSPMLFFDGLVFGEDKQGNINHLFYVNNPTTAYEKVAWYDSTSFNYPLLGACVLLFLSTLIWPIGFLFNRCHTKSEKPGRAARWVAGAACMLDLLFMAGLVALSAVAPMSIIYGIPSSLSALLAIAIVAAVLALSSTALAVLAWKDSYWSIAGRVHYTLVVLALLAFIWWLNNWNLLGFRF